MKNLKPALAGAVMVVMVAGAAAQTVYRIVGPDGKVTFSDKPPVTPANTTARSTSARAAEPNPAVGNLPYELRQVLARYPVTLYSGVGCAPCNSGRLMLQGRGIPYTEYTVASNDDIDALQRLSGEKSLPLLTIGGQKIKGFAEAEWTQFLNAANYPTTSQLPPNFKFAQATPLVSTQKLSTAPEAGQAREAADESTAAAPTASPVPSSGPTPSNPAGIKF
ncbi:MAG: glutaredoxin family protein [Burkholderiaceae bacterium]